MGKAVGAGLGSAVLAALGYIALLAAGLFVAERGFGLHYLEPGIVRGLLPTELLLSLYALAMARRLFGHWHCGYGPLRWRGLAGLLPYAALLAGFCLVLAASGGATATPTALVTVAAMLLLGFSEELTFRGIVLKGALPALGPAGAVLLSAALFTLMHVANLLAGEPLAALLPQLSYCFLFGLSMGCIALRANSLVPLMALHALWDIAMFLSTLWGVGFGPLVLVAILVNAAVAIGLWWALLRRQAA